MLKRLSMLILSALLASCDVAESEVARIPSPDGRIDLVISSADSGATTSVSYFVNLVPRNGKPDKEKSSFVADKVANLNVYWADAKRVVIQYSDARVFHFSNFWHAKEIDNFEHVVQLRLKEDGY